MNKEEQKAHKREKFLKELSVLSLKHGIVIDGCGCCGSPFISEMDKDDTKKTGYELNNGNIKWKGRAV